MPLYRVRWEIDLDAESPLEAAALARATQLDPDNIATSFEVVYRDLADLADNGSLKPVLIDFDTEGNARYD
jgi:hypothetical protein